MKKKILTISQLRTVVKNLKKKKIVLVHGVFDLVHLGHIEYFKEAKNNGDILVASVTSDKHVNKGLNKPYFNEENRCNFLSSIELIDYVVLSDSSSSVNIIKNIKPHFYCKGPDYQKRSGDKAGNFLEEKKLVENNGGKVIITTGMQFSSTAILSDNFEDFNNAKKNIQTMFKNNIEKEIFLEKFQKDLTKIKNQKILVIGEIIVDKYMFAMPLGTPAKENIIAVNYQNTDTYLGGTVPVVKNLMQLCDNLTFVSLFNNLNIKNRIKKELNKKVNLKIFYQKDYIEIEKSRFLNKATKSKIFEFYKFKNIEYQNILLANFLKKNLHNFDKVIVCDFGHGLFNDKIIKIIEKYSKFVCANIQTNAGNRGFNLFTKYNNIDFLCIDEPEFRMGTANKFHSVSSILAKNNKLKKYKNFLITLGINGLIIRFIKKRKSKIFIFPALASKAVDTMGAGDAVFSFTSALINVTKDNRVLPIIGSIAGALKTKILGHSSFVLINDVIKSLNTILK
jgi:rfaE bifunctional protein nucleotidyltransferase chain/domain